jgi:hypothetical protein
VAGEETAAVVEQGAGGVTGGPRAGPAAAGRAGGPGGVGERMIHTYV